jgi:hypothetical protein
VYGLPAQRSPVVSYKAEPLADLPFAEMHREHQCEWPLLN